ncbi:MAG: hypothetical protein ACRD21_23075 [Vicinamibacteria bacterium]
MKSRSALGLVLTLAGASPLLAAEGGELPRIVNFAILAAILLFALRKPLGDYLNQTTEQIKEQLREAKTRQENADVEGRRAEELLASLGREVEKAKEEARRVALAEQDRILKSAEQEAARILEIAKKEIDAEVEAGRRKLLAHATEISVELARKKLSSSMTESDRKRLVDRSIEILGRPR